MENLNLNDLSIELFQELNVIKSTKDASAGVIMFVMAFAGALLNLPCFLLLNGVESIFRRIIWRYLGLILVLSPRFAFDVLANMDSIGKILFANVIPVFFLAAINTAYVYMVYFAVSHTFVAHTLLLSSIATTFLATWKIAQRAPYTTIEYIGIGVNVFGAYLCCCEGAPISSIHVPTDPCRRQNTGGRLRGHIQLGYLRHLPHHQQVSHL